VAPCLTGLAEAVLTMEISALAPITVVTEEVLFAAVGSICEALTTAVLTAEPTVCAITETVKMAVAFTARLAAVQVTVPALKEHPALAELKLTCAGRVSVTTIVVATVGPLFFAVRVYVIVSPWFAVAGPVLVMDISDAGEIMVDALAVLLMRL
jgi:hypothetical protein